MTLQSLEHHLLAIRPALDSVSLGRAGQKAGGRGRCGRTGVHGDPGGGGANQEVRVGVLKAILVEAGGGTDSQPDRTSGEASIPLLTRPRVCAVSEGPLRSATSAHRGRATSSMPERCQQETQPQLAAVL